MRALRTFALLTLSFCALAHAGLTLSIKPSIFFQNGAQLGIDLGNLVPYAGLSYAMLKVKQEYSSEGIYSHQVYDTVTGTIYTVDEPRTYKSESDFSAHLLIPTIGMKVFLQRETLSPYLTGSLFYVLPIFDMDYEEDGKTEEYFTDDEKADIRKAISTLGIYAGAGAEYFFADQFSIGGEFGLNLMFDRATFEELTETKFFAMLGLTYSTISLSFYF
jgi:hypothetical protein